MKLGLFDFIKLLVEEGSADVDESDIPKDQNEGKLFYENSRVNMQEIRLFTKLHS